MTCSKSAVNKLKCKGDETSDTCADMKQISIWLANKAGNKYPEQ